jgi:hypothetical protein
MDIGIIGATGNIGQRVDEGNLPFASRLMASLLMTGHWRNGLLSEAKLHFSAVAQTVGFGNGSSKILYLSLGVD